jgi:Colicin immunity protein / pyocin immunity protein
MGNMNRKLTRAEMIVLVDKIRRTEGTEEEMDADLELFIANCLHPSGSDLIFWPHGFPHNRELPEPTTEEIVDKALDPGSVIKF